MKNIRWCSVLVLASLLVAGAAWAAESFRYGADLRLREEAFDNIPIIADPPGVTRGGENNYFRIRPRIWTELDPMKNVTLRARIVNETRIWETPASMAGKVQRSTYKFPDEWVFDHLYLDLRSLFGDNLDVRIGRQDLIYGTGKVVLEGTPKDGSRTIYFNAIKAVFKGIENNTVDVFGIYNPSIDEIAINDADRDLTGKTSANDDITESGGGIYWKNKSIADLPCELYYIYKNESDWQLLNKATTSMVDMAEADIHTVGFRVMPKLSDTFNANLEGAYQMGERGDVDLEGWMVDAALNANVPVAEAFKPVASVGFYYLSGDDKNTTDKNEGWVPLWSRYPQYSELYVYSWDAEEAGRWSNVMMPYAQLALQLCKNIKTTAMVGQLMAPEENGPGGGDQRGLLGVLKAEFTLAEKLLCSRDKLTGHLWAEILEPGDYYNVDDTAYFLRWEVLYAF